jgi:hypothetical protein
VKQKSSVEFDRQVLIEKAIARLATINRNHAINRRTTGAAVGKFMDRRASVSSSELESCFTPAELYASPLASSALGREMVRHVPIDCRGKNLFRMPAKDLTALMARLTERSQLELSVLMAAFEPALPVLLKKEARSAGQRLVEALMLLPTDQAAAEIKRMNNRSTRLARKAAEYRG